MKNIAVITGASSGIGREFAVQIAKRADIDQLWLIARSKDKLIQAAEEIYKQTSVPSLVMPFDLLEQDSFEKIENRLQKSDVNVKILVNSSGFGVSGDTLDMEIEPQLDMVDLNCRALLNMTYICLPYMSKGSNIVQIASAAAYVPQPGFAVYAATKSFVLSFSLALSYELDKYGVSVTSVCPGPVDTNFFHANEKYNAVFPKSANLFFKKAPFVVRKSINAMNIHKRVVNPGMAVKMLCLATAFYRKQVLAIVSKRFYR